MARSSKGPPARRVGDVQIYPGVHIGEGAVLEGPAVLGKPPRGRAPGELSLSIGPGAVIRPFTTIYAGTAIGARFQSGQGATIREDNTLGDDVSVGTNAVLEYGNRVGNGTRIHSLSFLERATLGDHVFVGPGTVFTDDPHPMGCPRYQDCNDGVTLEDFVKVGAHCTFLPGVRVGRNTLVGAGSLVTRSLPPDVVAAGHPARVLKSLDELTCPPGFFERPYVWSPYR
jgi:acetyltransferase-like isoleucine patch superfamily enzyme